MTLTNEGLTIRPDFGDERNSRFLEQFNHVVVEWVLVFVNPAVDIVGYLKRARRRLERKNRLTVPA